MLLCDGTSSEHVWKENSKFKKKKRKLSLFPTTYATIRFHLAYVGSVRWEFKTSVYRQLLESIFLDDQSTVNYLSSSIAMTDERDCKNLARRFFWFEKQLYTYDIDREYARCQFHSFRSRSPPIAALYLAEKDAQFLSIDHIAIICIQDARKMCFIYCGAKFVTRKQKYARRFIKTLSKCSKIALSTKQNSHFDCEYFFKEYFF